MSAPWRAAAFLLLSLCATRASAQSEALRPHSMYEPPMAAAAATLAASQSTSPADLLTTGEKTNWRETGEYAEVQRLMRLIAKRSPLAQVISFGTTAENRPMEALVLSKDRAFTPEAAHRTGKAIILIQSGIHPGEIEGKDTSLMLARDMVIAKRPHQVAWLDSAIFVILPVFNIDGHESRSAFNRANQNGPEVAGTRQTAQLLNLNRDYVKAASPEMRAWLRLYHAWLPDFMFDNHVTDGADYQYDVTWDMAHHADIGAPARAWVNDRFIPQLNARMSAGGHMVSPYGALRKTASGRSEFFVEVFSPRYSHIYSAAMNRPCLLVESHSLKESRTRAWSHYDIMTTAIDIVTEAPRALHDAVVASDATDTAAAGEPNAQPVFLAGKTSDAAHPLVYHSLKIAPFRSEITGTDVPRYTADKDDLDTVIHDGVDTIAEAKEPLGFLIPLAWKEFADELALHGVQMERTPVALDQVFDTWRFADVKSVTGAMEGGTLMSYTLTPVKERMQMPAGSFWVPLHQQRARLILSLLHPAAPDALVRIGFGSAIFQPTGRIGANEYLTVPIANKVAEEHPQWMQEFQAKLAADPAFAADPQARVQWWIARSNYQPSAFNRYPIAQLWQRPW